MPDDYASRFRRALLEAKERCGKSSYALAKEAGINLSGLRKLETGQTLPLHETVVKLAAALGVGVEKLS
jgi:ribosome-binding protein aMBF1 (putative translation factor)